MKSVRVLIRVAILALAATVFVGLTAAYGDSQPVPVPSRGWQTARAHRPAAPQARQFPEFVGEGMLVGLYAVAGRLMLRLRLFRVPRDNGQPILLDI